MTLTNHRDVITGAAAGLISGLLLTALLQLQGAVGLMGVRLAGQGGEPDFLLAAFHLLFSVLVGACFGLLVRYEPQGHAASISQGLLYGLLWWILGPLTLMPIVLGEGPTWSVSAASLLFPSLIGHLLHGGLLGLFTHLLGTLWGKIQPSSLERCEPQKLEPKRIVILGGGFGGVSAAQRLEEIFSKENDVEITLVSQSNYLLFTPMLAEVAASGLEPQHISAPVRASCPRTQFIRAEIESIDTKAQQVRLLGADHFRARELPYDHLVLALGSIPNYFGLPGLEKNSFTLKTLQDAIELRNHVIGLLERADAEQDEEERRRQLTFVVAGGGFAGTEMIAELFDLVHSVLRYYPNIQTDELKFMLVHSQDRILPELSAELGAYALEKLRARGIEFLLGARVAGVSEDAVSIGDGRLIPTRTLVWTAGNQPNPLLQELPCERSKAGAVVAEDTLQVRGFQNLWAVGDCAQIPDVLSDGKFCPPTAQHALREGKAVAENIAAQLRGQEPKPFKFKALGILVALGHRTAVAEIRGRKFSGLFAWFLWRTIYLSKLPGLEKKVRVALDWTIDLFFPRDIVLTMNAEAPPLAQTMGMRSAAIMTEPKMIAVATAEERVR